MSTDFLLGETDIPYRTNYDIEALGLSAKAAQRLYTGEVDPVAVSQLNKSVGTRNPRWAQAAQCAEKDIEAFKRTEGQTDTSAMEATFLRLVKDLRDGADAYIAQTQKLTSNAMKALVKNLQKRGARNLAKVTPEQMVEATLEATDSRVITEHHKEALRVAMLPLLTKTVK